MREVDVFRSLISIARENKTEANLVFMIMVNFDNLVGDFVPRYLL